MKERLTNFGLFFMLSLETFLNYFTGQNWSPLKQDLKSNLEEVILFLLKLDKGRKVIDL